MNTSRVNLLPEADLTERITDLQRSIAELKGSQFAGSANVITQRFVSGQAADFTATVLYQTTTAYEMTVQAADATFANTPFIWRSFWDAATTPITTGFLTVNENSVPTDNQQKLRLYLWGADPAHTSFTFDVLIVLYGLNIGGFSVSQII